MSGYLTTKWNFYGSDIEHRRVTARSHRLHMYCTLSAMRTEISAKKISRINIQEGMSIILYGLSLCTCYDIVIRRILMWTNCFGHIFTVSLDTAFDDKRDVS